MENTISVIIGLLFLIIFFSLVAYTFLKKRKTDSEITENLKKEDLKITDDIIEVVHPEKNDREEPNVNPKDNTISEDIQSTINISSKTETEILRKLELFEKNKGFIKKDVNLNSLSKQFNTNTKYLSEIIKIHRNKQFNAYINELRINYITDRLLSEPNYIKTKITYLASDCGYTSHSTFTTIFTQIMEESPSVYIKKIKKEKDVY